MKQSDFLSGRIIGISDGVFAIAMTLPVFDLKPQLERQDPAASRGDAKRDFVCQLSRLCGVLTEASSPEPSYKKEHP